MHGAGAVEHKSSGGGADGTGKAERLARHLLAVKVLVILVAAGCIFIAELQRLLE